MYFKQFYQLNDKLTLNIIIHTPYNSLKDKNQTGRARFWRIGKYFYEKCSLNKLIVQYLEIKYDLHQHKSI